MLDRLITGFAAACVIGLAAPKAATGQEIVFMVRHAEQVQTVDDPPLTPKGEARARALAEFFRDANITNVYSSQALRTQQTAGPVAELLGIDVRPVPRADVPALVARIRRDAPAGRVLIVGHSETVPHILQALGISDPVSVDRMDYDNIFVVVNAGAGAILLRQRLPARLISPDEPQSSAIAKPLTGATRMPHTTSAVLAGAIAAFGFTASVESQNSTRILPAVADVGTCDIQGATLSERGATTGEVSTEELRQILRANTALVLDTRPHLEWALGHIPGALNVAPKPGMPMSLYTSDVAEVLRLTANDRSRPLVLYCNGPFCGKSKRVADDLLAAGFSNVRRYQLGAPVWRALGGVMQVEPDGVRHIHEADGTALFVDSRSAEQFRGGSLGGARNIPVHEVAAAKDDGRLPMEDHNTRIVVFGGNPEEARRTSEEIARNAFHNVSYFGGTLVQLQELVRR
jgi:rhodanese-related sulfurtransferase/phosphohistidine phosphatase SixA